VNHLSSLGEACKLLHNKLEFLLYAFTTEAVYFPCQPFIRFFTNVWHTTSCIIHYVSKKLTLLVILSLIFCALDLDVLTSLFAAEVEELKNVALLDCDCTER
jgi:hypothetical protein